MADRVSPGISCPPSRRAYHPERNFHCESNWARSLPYAPELKCWRTLIRLVQSSRLGMNQASSSRESHASLLVDALCYLDTLQWYDSPFAAMMLNFLQLSVVFLVALCSTTYADVACPREEYLVPFGCRSRSAGRLQCTDNQDEKTFDMISAACKGYESLVSPYRRHRFGRFGRQPADSTILLWNRGQSTGNPSVLRIDRILFSFLPRNPHK